jgi:hypothetical protein
LAESFADSNGKSRNDDGSEEDKGLFDKIKEKLS